MILGTNANCKITNISITDTKAIITLLIFATNSTVPAKSFNIYIKDENNPTMQRINNNTYWIDRINNYNNDTKNIDTNKYKEILLEIDITNNNESKIQLNRWVRSCYIYLIDSTNPNGSIAWSSDRLTLVSDEFEIPEVKNISFYSSDIVRDIDTDVEKATVNVNFELNYISEKDFNYNNSNILATINVLSVSTRKILETVSLNVSTNIKNSIKTSNKYILGEAIAFEIIITNRNGEVLKKITKIHRPFKKISNTYIKTKDGIKKVLTFFVYTSTEKPNSNWQSLNNIKVNYNNAAIRTAKKIKPSFKCNVYKNTNNENCLKIIVDDNLNEETYYDNYVFDIYLNNKIIYSLDKNTDKTIVVEGIRDLIYASVSIQIKGKYYKGLQEYYFETEIVTIKNYPVCSNLLVCSEQMYCAAIIYGYIHDNIFYESFINGEYISQIQTTEGIFVDIPTDILYKWNGSENKFVVL